MIIFSDLDWRTIISGLAVVVGTISNVDYFLAIKRGETRPHIITWFIWGVITLIAAVAQAAKGVGVGNWAMIYTSIFCFVVTIYAFKRGEKQITRFDWFCGAAALLAVPLWQITHNPFWSVVCVGLIDVLAYIPTFRKSWHKPSEEKLRPYLVANVKFILAIIASEAYNATTLFYPALIIITNFLFVAMVVMRRQQGKQKEGA